MKFPYYCSACKKDLRASEVLSHDCIGAHWKDKGEGADMKKCDPPSPSEWGAPMRFEADTTMRPSPGKTVTLTARKDDSEKPRLGLIPPEAIEALGAVLTAGAKEYGARNWELGLSYERVYGALQRHLNAFWGGQDKCPKSGMSHLWHAMANIAFLVTYESRGIGEDDRGLK